MVLSLPMPWRDLSLDDRGRYGDRNNMTTTTMPKAYTNADISIALNVQMGYVGDVVNGYSLEECEFQRFGNPDFERNAPMAYKLARELVNNTLRSLGLVE